MLNSNQNIVYRKATSEDCEYIRKFLCDIGWVKYLGNDEQFSQMLDNSDRKVVATKGSRIVGFGRAICDNVSNGYISMVAVDSDMRGSKIGSRLVSELIGNDRNIKWVLTSADDSYEFWQKQGFEFLNAAMVRPRERDMPEHSPLRATKTFKYCIVGPLRKIRRFINFKN